MEYGTPIKHTKNRIVELLIEEGLAGYEYFSKLSTFQDENWPAYDTIFCYVTPGTNEGYRIQIAITIGVTTILVMVLKHLGNAKEALAINSVIAKYLLENSNC